MSDGESVTPVVIRGIPVTFSDHQQKSANNILIYNNLVTSRALIGLLW